MLTGNYLVDRKGISDESSQGSSCCRKDPTVIYSNTKFDNLLFTLKNKYMDSQIDTREYKEKKKEIENEFSIFKAEINQLKKNRNDRIRYQMNKEEFVPTVDLENIPIIKNDIDTMPIDEVDIETMPIKKKAEEFDAGDFYENISKYLSADKYMPRVHFDRTIEYRLKTPENTPNPKIKKRKN